MFEPVALGPGPSGFADRPRPFVLRARHLDGQTVEPDSAFHVDLNLFDLNSPAAVASAIRALAELSVMGLGPTRGRVQLLHVTQLEESGQLGARLYRANNPVRINLGAPLSINLSPERPEPVTRIRIHFLSPTELKDRAQIAPHPDFAILAARVRDRLSILRELYGPGPLDIDFSAFRDRAANVQMTHCDVQQVNLERISSRTGQRHSLGGFIGEAEYEGDLTEFLPYLRCAQWTGVGRHTVWGNGELRVEL